jgi:hypothetical protein
MKSTRVLGILGALALSFSFGLSAYGVPAFPRDLVCDIGSQQTVTLKSNNSFWSHAENGKYSVSLVIDSDAGQEVLSVAQVNNEAQRTRGNDAGLREYIFVSEEGEEFFVQLEFNAPSGQATGLKKFRVFSLSLSFEHSQRTLNGICDVIFYGRTEI